MIRMIESKRRPRGRVQIGPGDHGRLLSLDEWDRSCEEPGHVYELIDGVLHVSPRAKPFHDQWVTVICQSLRNYAARHPRVINYVSEEAEVVVHGRLGPTRPAPDVAAYKGFPRPAPSDWDQVTPIIVVEVISPRRNEKDMVRNRHLYGSVRGISEYWIVDPTKDAERPTLTILTRRPRSIAWQPRVILFGDSYKTKLLPGFSLNLNKSKGR
ncbi:MAG: Uma2 family endonuclease [Planctomycetes bacterium]|nr:Uma2 family endonuclease [Planctomycetota bacterium]